MQKYTFNFYAFTFFTVCFGLSTHLSGMKMNIQQEEQSRNTKSEEPKLFLINKKDSTTFFINRITTTEKNHKGEKNKQEKTEKELKDFLNNFTKIGIKTSSLLPYDIASIVDPKKIVYLNIQHPHLTQASSFEQLITQNPPLEKFIYLEELTLTKSLSEKSSHLK